LELESNKKARDTNQQMVVTRQWGKIIVDTKPHASYTSVASKIWWGGNQVGTDGRALGCGSASLKLKITK